MRLVKLLIDGNQVATNNYACTYEDFLACQESASDTIAWNTATVTDGQHSLEAIVEDAAQNTTILEDTTISTDNAPTNTTAPAVIAPNQPSVGQDLTAQVGGWTAPTGAGPITYGYQWEDCNNEGNDCQAIPTADTASYTPAPSDTGHTLRVLVRAADQDGVSSQTSAATSSIFSPAAPLGTLPAPGTPAGVPNGTTASETATLHLDVPGRLSRSFARRAFKLAGQLINSQGQPIANATLDVLTQNAGASTPTVINHATTSPTGAFTVEIPAGPSRLIEIGYRAYASDNAYTATARVQETVAAGVQLNITPRSISPTATIVLAGKVQGPIPRQGTIVELLVHYRGKWEPFRDPTTNSHGSFRVAYQFQGAIGDFPFRAEIPAGQAGFPYASGYSSIVDVSTE